MPYITSGALQENPLRILVLEYGGRKRCALTRGAISGSTQSITAIGLYDLRATTSRSTPISRYEEPAYFGED